MKIAGTGPRPKNLGFEYSGIGRYSNYIRKEVKTYLEILQPELIYSGMAEGYDRILAQVAIELRIKVIAAIPFIGQDSLWSEESRKIHTVILTNKLVTVHYVCQKETTKETEFWQIAKWLQDRNEWMVNQLKPNEGDKLLACWDGRTEKSGTYNCLKYAWKKIPKESITIIDPKNA